MAVTLKRLWTQPYRLELRSALSWGKDHRLDQLDHVLVYAELSNGATGVAEAPPRPSIYGETPESIAAIIARECSDLLIGQRIESLEDIHAAHRKLNLIRNNNTAKGALDLALHAAFARSQGQALADLLHVTQSRVRVSFILGTGTLDEVLDEAQWVYECGVRVLKVKVGKDFTRETEQIRRIRQAFGDSLELYVDANQCYTLDEADQYLPVLADLGVKWCEEPLPIHHLKQRQTLRNRGILPLIADDSAFTLSDLAREIEFETFDVLNIKTARNGFSEAGVMLRGAQAAGKGVMVGSQAGSLLGCLHALLFSGQSGIDYPAEGTFYLKVNEAVSGALTITDGWIDLAQAQAVLDQLDTMLLRQKTTGNLH
ncbi:MAG TPA: enolase C-terminal domain-like protein [Spirillospora sp.]|nr:enolase C-terminal domain-like protein [Spirillospora sp.]